MCYGEDSNKRKMDKQKDIKTRKKKSVRNKLSEGD